MKGGDSLDMGDPVGGLAGWAVAVTLVIGILFPVLP